MDNWIIIVVTIIFSAFFSGMEIAFVSSNRMQIEIDKKRNPVYSFLLNLFTNNQSQFIATMLVGNNIALVTYGIAFADLIEPWLATFIANDSMILLVQTICSTIIILFTAEFIPKSIFNINPNFSLKLFAVPVAFFYFIFYPITYLTIRISNGLLKNVLNTRFKERKEQIVFSKVDLNHFIKQAEVLNEAQADDIENEVKLIRNALDFSNVKLRECMVPRTELQAIVIDATVEQLRQKFVISGFSKILIYENNIDNVVGYVHISDLFHQPKTIKEVLHSISIVPETMPAQKLFNQFVQEHKSIAVVVDEFGGTAGVVTSEDILEEIFGEIEDEHDNVDLLDKRISDNEFLLSGRLEIDHINEQHGLELPVSEEYETLAGFILHIYQSIPEINTTISYQEFEIKILKATNTRIEVVIITRILEK